MKRFALLASALLLAGCGNAVTDSGSGTGMSNPAPAHPAASEFSTPVLVSFNAGETTTLEVPEMHCPYACYPTVKEALEDIDGVAGVDLVQQEEEGTINDRRVVVTFDGAVDGAKAIAALDQVNFRGSSFEVESN